MNLINSLKYAIYRNDIRDSKYYASKIQELTINEGIDLANAREISRIAASYLEIITVSNVSFPRILLDPFKFIESYEVDNHGEFKFSGLSTEKTAQVFVNFLKIGQLPNPTTLKSNEIKELNQFFQIHQMKQFENYLSFMEHYNNRNEEKIRSILQNFNSETLEFTLSDDFHLKLKIKSHEVNFHHLKEMEWLFEKIDYLNLDDLTYLENSHLENIVPFFPNLTHLSLKNCLSLRSEALDILSNDCKNVKYLNIKGCYFM